MHPSLQALPFPWNDLSNTTPEVCVSQQFSPLAASSNLAAAKETVCTINLVKIPNDPSDPPPHGDDGTPFNVNYKHRFAAAGKIPGSVTRREGRPSDAEVLSARIVDRAIRPLLESEEGVELEISVQSKDKDVDDLLVSLPASFAALEKMSDIEFKSGSEVYRLTMVDGKPQKVSTGGEMIISTLNGNVVMLEFGVQKGAGLKETDVVAMLKHAAGSPSSSTPPQPPTPPTGWDKWGATAVATLQSGAGKTKDERGYLEAKLKQDMIDAEDEDKVYGIFKTAIKENAFNDVRSDGRGLDEIRELIAVAPCLPDQVHGSAFFSRGETQVLSSCTLGIPENVFMTRHPYEVKELEITGDDEEKPVGSLRALGGDALADDLELRRLEADRRLTGAGGRFVDGKTFYLHYDFPGYSVGEKAGNGIGRREVGHGNLAEKSLIPVIPNTEDFPYVIRLTSEVMSSNGSSSMASVCAGTMALLDAGVPILSPVAGVSVGLAERAGEFKLLTDITGTEDHFGEMDFKVAGTTEGITSMQLDVKLAGGVPVDVLVEALEKARVGRLHILGQIVQERREKIKDTAPMVEVVRYDATRMKDLVGPGGAVINQIEAAYGVVMDLSQEGVALIYGGKAKQARNAVNELVADVEEGGIYEGVILELKDFGCVVEVLRNKEALLHVSEISNADVSHPSGNAGVVSELVAVGMKIDLVCIGVDKVRGHIKMSRAKLVKAGKDDTEMQEAKLKALEEYTTEEEDEDDKEEEGRSEEEAEEDKAVK
ncbi:hypothetical protein TL16_g01546 [Triparma laevis f. inornata]|uniref:polyribonucleotide nucleotidyltransferase n=1 Tax=Triparma laevis f. inornata TaxID=1714386 RepID=A0A9W6ZKF6_9STRA|nr:hypothetical protein TL16_g01546 [Triparma laevis f. inornata]